MRALVRLGDLLERANIWMLVGLTVLVRALVAVFAPAFPNLPDALAYSQGAQQLWAAGQIVDNNTLPVYPLFRLITGDGVATLIAEFLLSGLCAWLLFLLAQQLGGRRLAGVLAALVWAIYPMAAFYAVVGLTENFFVALMLGATVLLYRRSYWAASLLLVLAGLTRGSVEIVGLLMVASAAVIVHRERWAVTGRAVAVYVALYVVLSAPWWWHNYEKFGVFERTTLADGVVLYAGNNPLNWSGGGVGDTANAPPDFDMAQFDHLLGDPVARRDAQVAAAMDFISENPDRFVELAWIKFLRFWRLTPFTPDYQVWWIDALLIVSYGPVLAFAICYLAVFGWRRFWHLSPVLGFIAFVMLVHMATIASIRYRFPVEPFLIVFAAMFVDRVWPRGRSDDGTYEASLASAPASARASAPSSASSSGMPASTSGQPDQGP